MTTKVIAADQRFVVAAMVWPAHPVEETEEAEDAMRHFGDVVSMLATATVTGFGQTGNRIEKFSCSMKIEPTSEGDES